MAISYIIFFVLAIEEVIMETFAITIYVISDEVLTILGNQDDPQSAMSNAEVITVAILHTKS